ncbi:Cyclic-di-AMP phosphodiesterase OS=Ureibacillus acetophenoni OX=614649 GN=SAMN05877842_105186 PE=3 SV=1 [Ureibacillus acetophenoni]
MDSIGASMGVRKMVEKSKVKGHIIVNFNELNGSVNRLMKEIEKVPEIYENFISPGRCSWKNN